MTAPEILATLARQGVRVTPEGDALRLWPRSLVTTEICDVVRDNKIAILDLLRWRVGHALGGVKGTTLDAEEACQMMLCEFARSGLRVEVRSTTLKETIIIASDGVAVEPAERGRTYTVSELLAVAGIESMPGQLRNLHRAKMDFHVSLELN